LINENKTFIIKYSVVFNFLSISDPDLVFDKCLAREEGFENGLDCFPSNYKLGNVQPEMSGNRYYYKLIFKLCFGTAIYIANKKIIIISIMIITFILIKFYYYNFVLNHYYYNYGLCFCNETA